MAGIATASARLDPTFSRDGLVYAGHTRTLGFPAPELIASRRGGVLLAKCVTEGSPPLTCPLVIARFTNGGELDHRFGNDGYLETGINSFAFGFTETPSRKVVTAGMGENGLTIRRFKPNGARDPTFGRNGEVNPFPRSDPFDRARPMAVSVDRRGRTVVAGAAFHSDDQFRLFLMRFTRKGHRDKSFGDNGLTEIWPPAGEDLDVLKLQIDKHGRPYVLIEAWLCCRHPIDFVHRLIRIPANGQRKGRKLMIGVTQTRTGAYHELETFLLDGRGRIVAVELKNELDSSGRLYVSRYDSNGKRDRSFGGGDGQVAFINHSQRHWAQVKGLTLDHEGRILMSAKLDAAPMRLPTEPFIVRLTPSGTKDRSFGVNGRLLVGPPSRRIGVVYGLDVDRRNRLIIGALARPRTPEDRYDRVIVVARHG